MAAADSHVDLYYVNFAEVPWHRLWLERGERYKAIGYFYMTLTYSVSRDLHLGQERFCPQLPWMIPWQPNASGNGRVLSMILSTLIFIKNRECFLLQGVPDAWFVFKAPLGVDELWIAGTRVSFRLEKYFSTSGWHFTYSCIGSWVPDRFQISLPLDNVARIQKSVFTHGVSEGKADLIC